MTFFKKIALLLGGLAMLTINSGQAAKAEEKSTINFEQVDKLLSDTQKKLHLPSLTVTLFDQDQLLFSKAYGEGGGVDRVQQIGSTTKSMTALAIMQLVEEGKIKLNAPVSTYLPEVQTGEKMTVKQLLTHTSGIKPNVRQDRIGVTETQGKFAYANNNYSLLGDIIEQASGQSYEDYMAEHIFKPLGMSRTTGKIDQAKAWGLLDGHKTYFGFKVKSDPEADFPSSGSVMKPYGQTSAGYVSSTTEDMTKYLQMYLKNGQNLVKSDSIQQMWTDTVPTPREGVRYGYGWTRSEVNGKRLLYHDGATQSGMAFIFVFPELGIGGVALSNTADPLGQSLWNMAFFDKLTSTVAGKKPVLMGNDYTIIHSIWNTIFAVLIVIPSLSFLRLKGFKQRLTQGKGKSKDGLFFVLLHILLPIGLIMALPMGVLGLPVPMALVRISIPDFYWVIILSASLMILAGLAKLYLFWKQKQVVNTSKKEEEAFND